MDTIVVAIPAQTRGGTASPRARTLEDAPFLEVLYLEGEEITKDLNVGLPPASWEAHGFVYTILDRHKVQHLIVEDMEEATAAMVASMGVTIWRDTESPTVGDAVEAWKAGSLEQVEPPA